MSKHNLNLRCIMNLAKILFQIQLNVKGSSGKKINKKADFDKLLMSVVSLSEEKKTPSKDKSADKHLFDSFYKNEKEFKKEIRTKKTGKVKSYLYSYQDSVQHREELIKPKLSVLVSQQPVFSFSHKTVSHLQSRNKTYFIETHTDKEKLPVKSSLKHNSKSLLHTPLKKSSRILSPEESRYTLKQTSQKITESQGVITQEIKDEKKSEKKTKILSAQKYTNITSIQGKPPTLLTSKVSETDFLPKGETGFTSEALEKKSRVLSKDVSHSINGKLSYSGDNFLVGNAYYSKLKSVKTYLKPDKKLLTQEFTYGKGQKLHKEKNAFAEEKDRFIIDKSAVDIQPKEHSTGSTVTKFIADSIHKTNRKVSNDHKVFSQHLDNKGEILNSEKADTKRTDEKVEMFFRKKVSEKIKIVEHKTKKDFHKSIKEEKAGKKEDVVDSTDIKIDEKINENSQHIVFTEGKKEKVEYNDGENKKIASESRVSTEVSVSEKDTFYQTKDDSDGGFEQHKTDYTGEEKSQEPNSRNLTFSMKIGDIGLKARYNGYRLDMMIMANSYSSEIIKVLKTDIPHIIEESGIQSYILRVKSKNKSYKISSNTSYFSSHKNSNLREIDVKV